MLSGYEAESELFRGGDCRDDEDAEYEEYLRQEAEQRARVKARAAAGIQPAVAAASSAPKPAAPPPQRLVRETLEAEHAERADAHRRRVQVEQRLDTYVAFWPQRIQRRAAHAGAAGGAARVQRQGGG